MKTCIKTITKLLFYINLLPAIRASCDLLLSNDEWSEEWHLLLTKDSNGKYQLLRENTIPDGQTLYMFCGNNPQPITATCGQNQQFVPTLPLPSNRQCDKQNSIRPTMIEERNNGHCQYNLYKIGFNIENTFHEVYQVCFDHGHMRPVFTINKAYPMGAQRPKVKFNNQLRFSITNAFEKDKVVKRFNNLLGDNQRYVVNDNPDRSINRGHISPSADFATAVLMNSTFSMINIMAQFRTIDNGNWKKIEEWARTESRTPANICTGVLDCNLNSDLSCILKLKHTDNNNMVPIYLSAPDKIPVPLWLYKIVKSNKNVGTVFLTYNYIVADDKKQETGDINLPDVCKEEDSCPSDVQLDQQIVSGITFCCDYNEFINRAVPKLKNLC